MKESIDKLYRENEYLKNLNAILQADGKRLLNANERSVYYKKVGKKYVQVNDPWAYDGLGEGFWLVQVRPGSTSIRHQVYPASSALTAAVRLKEDELIKIIREASEARPRTREISEEALRDWKKFIKKHGEEFNNLEYPSLQENAEKIIKALIGENY
jgi:DNA mismatch repair ATPase MutS